MRLAPDAMNTFREVMEWVGLGFDATGVLVIAGGVLIAAGRLAAGASGTKAMGVRRFRQDFGGAIVLGLEFLVAGDIIRTVVVAPTLENVAVLAIIVLIRTVLSMALQVEIEGRWPWQRHDADARGHTQSQPSTTVDTDVAGQRARIKRDRN
ncbi:putative membrane protein [Variovorax sp. WDL1]|nr:putative membrane protein [Variovorax sp. WDL1]